MLGMKVLRTFLRNTKTTSTTSPTEISRVRSTSWTEARMVWVWSMATRKSMDAGMAA